MAAGINPIFVATPRFASASTGVNANTALDGSGTITTLFTAGSNGSYIEDVYLTHLGTNVATVVRFFVDITGLGTSYKLLHEETMAANTLSQTADSVSNYWGANIVLPAGATVGITIGTAIAAGIMVSAVGGDF